MQLRLKTVPILPLNTVAETLNALPRLAYTAPLGGPMRSLTGLMVLFLMLTPSCGDDESEKAKASFLEQCGDFCQYGYERAQRPSEWSCSDEEAEEYLAWCRSSCFTQNDYDADCKKALSGLMDCMDNKVYTCPAGDVWGEDTGCLWETENKESVCP